MLPSLDRCLDMDHLQGNRWQDQRVSHHEPLYTHIPKEAKTDHLHSDLMGSLTDPENKLVYQMHQ
jgi:hypothetical protein